MNTSKQIIFGRKPVIEAIQSGIDIEKVIVLQTLSGEIEVELRKLSKDNNFQIQRVPSVKLDHLSKGENHQGVIAYVAPIKYYRLENKLAEIRENKKDVKILIIDGVEDVRNFGAIVRSAYAYEIDLVVIFSSGSAKVNDVAIKTSAGALLHVPVCKEDNLSQTLAFIAEQGIKIMVSSLKSSEPLENISFDGDCAIIIGSENRGVNKLSLDYADHIFCISHSAKMESLNVSVAAGIIFNHMYQQNK